MSNQTKYNDFRETYPTFVYEAYRYDVQPDGLHIVFSFRIGSDILFQPTATIPHRDFLRFDQPREVLDTLVFNIGMIELVSYWKCYCPPRVIVQCGTLSKSQQAFWKKIYYNGLGEFFYVNGITATMEDFMDLSAASSQLSTFNVPKRNVRKFTFETGAQGCQRPTGANSQLSSQAKPVKNYLVPIGGGKDSVVTLELLRDTQPRPLIMNPRGATVGCIEAAGYTMDDVLVIQRTIDPRLLELNRQGALNGHTPFSAMLAFYTLLAAQLSGIPNIALSNESSANESTVAGTGINHQYSKSLEFENDFRTYVREHIGGGYNYFSFLRPLSELQIAMLFSRYTQYHDVFRSCNAGSKQDIWCGCCPKCLFAYIILSPFIAPERLNAIFGKAMLDDPAMQLYFDQLTGRAETKPFECVGTISEVHAALSLTLSRWYPGERPCLLKEFERSQLSNFNSQLSCGHNLTPDELHRLLHRRILIAGYGREGKSSHRLLTQLLPNADITVAHNDEEIYAALAKEPRYDLIVKSPGIPMMKLEGRCDLSTVTSQTDLFLQRYGAQTVAVTGTKGKSTTTTLIHHILASSRNTPVLLAGNMGIPLFDIIDQITPDTLIVAEFSCHQLENIHRAPHIAVLLNLYQEHLDHYHDLRGYQMAKMQIMLRQQRGDHAIYCTDSPDLAALVDELRPSIPSQLHPYSLSAAKPLIEVESGTLNSQLPGDHNRSNCYAAWLATSLLGVTPAQFADALATFQGLPHRLERVGTYRGITFYNDSISTIPEATIAAIEALKEVDTLILGGFDRGIDYGPLVRYLDGHPASVPNLVFVGEAGRRIHGLLQQTGMHGRNTLVEDDYPTLVRWCFEHTAPGRICLLSPAAASYDAFTNFEHRGNTFKELVSTAQ